MRDDLELVTWLLAAWAINEENGAVGDWVDREGRGSWVAREALNS